MGAFELSGYELREIDPGAAGTRLFRGRRLSDQRAVMVKVARGPGHAPAQARALEREYRLLAALGGRAAPGVLELVSVGGQDAALVYEACDWPSMRALFRRGRVPLARLLAVAIAVCEALALVHDQGVAHGRLNPESILIAPDDARVVFTDFSMAPDQAHAAGGKQRLDREDASVLAYVSPEGTGRVNRAVDARSDLYSLGATLYEGLTGRPPFVESDSLELLHSHIARLATPPCELDVSLPRAVSSIVMKLIDKHPDARYQSARGVKADLERCAEELRARGSVSAFAIGREDEAGSLRLPGALFGREHEAATMAAAFERARGGAVEFIMLTGPSGVGKSSVAGTLREVAIQSGGSFVSGARSELTLATPYASLLGPLDAFLRQRLMESEEALNRWRERLRAALGANGRVLTEVLPCLEPIIGEPPPAVELSPTEAANRFRTTLRVFIQAIAGDGHPLVMFIDDIDQSERGTLEFLRVLLTDQDTSHLVLLVTARGDRADTPAPLAELLDGLARARVSVTELRVGPLDRAQTARFVAEVLTPCASSTEAFAAFVHERSGGNPFFIHTFLRSLFEQGVFAFDRGARTWRWDSARLNSATYPDDLGSLVASRLTDISEQARRLLAIAACLGQRFERELLVAVSGSSGEHVDAAVHEAMARAFVRVVSVGPAGRVSEYEFIHDHVRRMTYEDISDAERGALHHRIGQVLLERVVGDADALEAQIFTVTSHLNLGAARARAADERVELARLNLIAGRKSMKATAYESAVGLLARARALIDEDTWRADYELARDVVRLGMEAEYLVGNHDRARALYDDFVAHADTALERTEALVLKVILESGCGQHRAALDAGVEGLVQIGEMIELNVTRGALMLEQTRVRYHLRGRSVHELSMLPSLADPARRAALRLLTVMTAPAFFIDPRLALLLWMRMASISLREGISDVSAYGFAGYGMFLAGARKQYARAAEFGQLAVRLNERHRSPWIDAKVAQVVGGYIMPWNRPFSVARRFLCQAYATAVDNGDLAYASFIAANSLFVTVLDGRDLQDTRELARSYMPFARRSGVTELLVLLQVTERMCMCLEGQMEGPAEGDAQRWYEREFLDGVGDVSPNTAFYCQLLAGVTLLHLGESRLFLEWARQRRARGARGFPVPAQAEWLLCEVLARAADYEGASVAQRRASRAAFRRALQDLERWSSSMPANFRARYLLARAEVERVTGRAPSLSLYLEAIERSRAAGCARLEGLAAELAARSSRAEGSPAAAEVYAHAAALAYERWGAAPLQDVSRVVASPRAEQGGGATDLEADTALRAARTISRELRLEELLRTLLRIVMAHAGARRCSLLLSTDEGLCVEAEARVELDRVDVLMSRPLSARSELPDSLVRYVARTLATVVLDDAVGDSEFRTDPDIAARGVRSILCMPIVNDDALTGVLYLENELTSRVFDASRLGLVTRIAGQLAVSIHNARLYRELERAHERAVSADRLETRFLINVSDALFSPLRRILQRVTAIELSLERAGAGASVERELRAIISASRLLERTLSGLLELSRAEADAGAAPIASCDVAAVVASLAESFVQAERVEPFSVVTRGALVPVRTSEVMLRHCLSNALESAYRVVAPGTLELRVEPGGVRERRELEVTIVGARPEGFLRATDEVDAEEVLEVSLPIVRRLCRIIKAELTASVVPGVEVEITITVPDWGLEHAPRGGGHGDL